MNNIDILSNLIQKHFDKLHKLKELITKQNDDINIIYDENMDLAKYLTDIKNYLKPSLDIKTLQLISSELNKTVPKSTDVDSPWFIKINYKLYENVKEKIKNIREIKNDIDKKIKDYDIFWLEAQPIHKLLSIIYEINNFKEINKENLDNEQNNKIYELIDKYNKIINTKNKIIEEINNISQQLLPSIDEKTLIMLNNKIEEIKINYGDDITNIYNELKEKYISVENIKKNLNTRISVFKTGIERQIEYNYTIEFFQEQYKTINDFKETNKENLDQQQNNDIISILNEYDTIIKYKENVNSEINEIETKLKDDQIDINIINNFFNVQGKKLDYEQKQKIIILYKFLDEKDNMDSKLKDHYESKKYIIDLDKQINDLQLSSNRIDLNKFDYSNINESRKLINNINKLLKELKSKGFSDDNEQVVTLNDLIRQYDILGNKINFYENNKKQIDIAYNRQLQFSKNYNDITIDKQKYIDQYKKLIKDIELCCEDVKYISTYDNKSINNVIESINLLIKKLK
jgi:hypothetical protein